MVGVSKLASVTEIGTVFAEAKPVSHNPTPIRPRTANKKILRLMETLLLHITLTRPCRAAGNAPAMCIPCQGPLYDLLGCILQAALAAPTEFGDAKFQPDNQHSLGQHSLGQHSLGQHSLGQHSLGQHSLGQHSLGQHSLGRQLYCRPRGGSTTATPTFVWQYNCRPNGCARATLLSRLLLWPQALVNTFPGRHDDFRPHESTATLQASIIEAPSRNQTDFLAGSVRTFARKPKAESMANRSVAATSATSTGLIIADGATARTCTDYQKTCTVFQRRKGML